MYRILFVCHGNICRSPMAEFIFLDMLKKRGITGVTAASAATSTEEIGNPVHYGTASILRRLGIDFSAKRARQMTRSDAEEYDLLVGMDGANIRSMTRIAGEKYSGKIRRLLDFADRRQGATSPTRGTPASSRPTYRDVCEGCEGLINWLRREKKL